MGVAVARYLPSPVRSLSKKGRARRKKDGGTKPNWTSLLLARDASDAGLDAGVRNYLAGRSRFVSLVAIVRDVAGLDRVQCYMQRGGMYTSHLSTAGCYGIMVRMRKCMVREKHYTVCVPISSPRFSPLGAPLYVLTRPAVDAKPCT